jgi:hypothetical protein
VGGHEVVTVFALQLRILRPAHKYQKFEDVSPKDFTKPDACPQLND